MRDRDDGTSVPADSEELMEELASIEHERWSHWQRYLHERCEPGADGSLTIPAEFARRWSAQMSTSYADLAEEDKESDREQVRRYLPLIVDAVRAEAGRRGREAIGDLREGS